MSIYTLEEALDSGRVFVLNRSKPKGNILITFIHPGDGSSFNIKISKTWIPIAVSDTVPLKVIADSIDFRSFLNSRMLSLIPREEAEKILKTSDALEEFERLNTKKHTDNEDNEDTEYNENNKNNKDNINKIISDENLIVKDILERNVDNKVSLTINELKSVEEELTENDIIYIIKNTEGKIRNWAEKNLSKIDKTYTGIKGAKRGRKPKVK